MGRVADHLSLAERDEYGLAHEGGSVMMVDRKTRVGLARSMRNVVRPEAGFAGREAKQAVAGELR